MKSLSFKQRMALLLIQLLECIVGSVFLVPLFKLVERIVYGSLLSKPRQKSNSIFSNIRVAFIADGNRRYHKKLLCKQGGKAKGASSTDPGATRILQIIKFAYIHRMPEVSFFCFSTKNFNRKKEEVESIMNYIRKKRELKAEVPFRMKIYGRLELVDEDVRNLLLEWEENTRSNTELTVNIFFAYSSSAAEHDNSRKFTGTVDLIVRTSGVRRLSDFMVRQAARGAALDFVRPLWPEYTNIHLWLTLAKYRLEEKYFPTVE